MERQRAEVLDRATASAIEIRVLGSFEAARGDELLDLGGPKQRAVLALLGLHGSRGLTVDGVIDGLWGEVAPESARSSVYSYVSNLRTVLGESAIERRRGTYVLVGASSDVDEFERLLDAAETAMAVEPASAARTLRDALDLWRGLPYADLLDVPGLREESRRLEELRVRAVEMLMDAELASGRGSELVSELRALVVEYPLREHFRGQLMVALYRAGRQAEALRTFDEGRELLLDELGVDPSPELRDLQLKVLEHDEGLLAGSGQVTTQRLVFLFTDIEASVRLWDLHKGEMATVLAAHDHILHAAVEEAGGTVFKHTGDGSMSVFSDAAAAAAAAERAQRSLQREDWGVIGELPVRMAIDVGDVDVREGDYFGPPLNRCARILAAAHGGQVLLSSIAFDDLSTGHLTGVQIRQLGPYRLRGLAAPERLGQLVFVGLPAEFPELRLDASAPDLGERWELGGLPGYELRGRLGLGWSGPVYRAYQPSVGRQVAIRVIRAELANEPSFVRRFEAHAREVAQLEHPHIVPLHDFWRDHQGAYLVMQLMRGGTLAREMRDRSWDPQAAATVLRQVGSALAHAHAEGVVHGDIRPENVLLDGAGNAYLSDFGLSPVLLSSEEALLPSAISCPYIAPEVRRGSTPDERSDVFSLAAIAAALFTGEPPTPEGDLPRFSAEVADPPAVGAALMRALAWEPDDRFTDVASLVEALEEGLGLADLPARASVRTGLRNPYKGLRAFTEGDAGDFHGRSALIDTLVDAVGMRTLVTVVGPSGSGKSSAVQAGLVPRLRGGALPGSDEWFIATMTPGSHPIAALVDAIRPLCVTPLGDAEGNLVDGAMTLADLVCKGLPEGSELLLVIDQFEELFTLVLDEDERQRFIELISAVENPECPVRIVLTLRADFYDRPLAYGLLAEVVAAGLVTVVPPTVDDLVDAIERPAGSVGLAFEPGLPLRMAGDVVGQPGGLPLLQYALTEMVEKRGADLLTSLDYEAIGTVSGAVARRAEATFSALDRGERDAARDVLLRLVAVDSDTDFTRRRVRLGELEALGHHPRAVRRVLDAFGRSRLLSFDRDPVSRAPTVEVAHEALLREWERLREWLANERGGLVLARRLGAAMEEWLESGRSDDYLLLGDRLSPFQQWARSSVLTADEKEFLDRSATAEANAHATRRRRRRAVLSALSAAVVVATILAIVALVQGDRADREAARAQTLAAQEADARAEAEEQATAAAEQAALAEGQAALAAEAADRARSAELLAKARELAAAAVSVGEEDPQLAMLLALEAFELAPESGEVPIELTFSLREAMYANRLLGGFEVPDLFGLHLGVGAQVFAVLGSESDGEWLEGVARFDLATFEEIWRLPSIGRLHALSPDGELMLFLSEEALEFRSIEDASLVETTPLGCAPGQWSMADWSPDGRLVAYMGYGCDAVVVIEASSGEEVRRIPVDPDEFLDVFFAESPAADRLYVSQWKADRAALIYDTRTWEEVAAFDTPIGMISPDGSTFFGMEWGETPFLFDVESGEPFDRLGGIGAAPNTYGAAFSPDGEFVLMPTEGAIVPIWEVATGEIAFTIPAGQGAESVFVGDGRLMTHAFDGQVRLWDLTGASAGELQSVDTGSVFGMRSAFASDSVGAVHGWDSYVGVPTAYAFDPATGALLGGGRAIPGRSFPWLGALGDLGVVFGETRDSDGMDQIVVWDGRTGEEAVLLDCAVDVDGCVDGMLDHRGMFSSVDGSEFGLLTSDRVFLAWDSAGRVLSPVPLDYEGGGQTEMLMSFTSNWILVRNDWSYYNVFDRQGRLISEFETFDHGWLRFDRTGEFAVGWGFSPGPVSVIDASDWSVRAFTGDLGGGLVRDATFSPSGDLVSLGIQGGPQRIMTFPDGDLVARIPLSSVVSSYWIDDEHVAVVTADGLWTVVTLDLDELRSLARGQLHRDFTADECNTYRIDSCAVGSGNE